MYEIRRYTPADKQTWDEFVGNSKNATFLLMRDYMDYHADRFSDHSLMFFDSKGKLVAMLPGNTSVSMQDGKAITTFHSHQGLTYGGFILSAKTGANEMMMLFDELISYLKANSFSTLYYKQIPTIYHLCPSQEDEYALWRHNAIIEVCNISATIDLRAMVQPKLAHTKKHRIDTCIQAGYTIHEDDNIDEYWTVLESCLNTRYGAKPVHTLEEMRLLQSKFPNNIRCITVRDADNHIAAGVILYIMNQVAHSQYSCATQQGYSDHAIDYLYYYLKQKFTEHFTVRYLDFGTSNEDRGHYLNSSLIAHKESFGARSVAYKQWKIDLTSSQNL